MSSPNEDKPNERNRSSPSARQICSLDLLSHNSNNKSPSSSSSSGPKGEEAMNQVRHKAVSCVKEMSKFSSRVSEEMTKMGIMLRDAETWMKNLEGQLQATLPSNGDEGSEELVLATANTSADHIVSRKRSIENENGQNDVARSSLEQVKGNSVSAAGSGEENGSGTRCNCGNVSSKRVVDGKGNSSNESIGEDLLRSMQLPHESNNFVGSSELEVGSSTVKDSSVMRTEIQGNAAMTMVQLHGVNSVPSGQAYGYALPPPAPKRKRMTWSLEENFLFIRVVLQNAHIGESQLRQLLADTFASSRDYYQCLGHLRVLRYQGRVPQQKDKKRSLGPK